MKKLILIAMMLPMLSIAQSNKSSKIAVANESRDTLFVVEDIAYLFISIWENADDKVKPTIVAVNDITAYVRDDNKVIRRNRVIRLR